MTILNSKSLDKQNTGELPLDSNNSYRAGTLVYTKISLFLLFAWLLWGDFCIVLTQMVFVNVLPLKLKILNPSNALIGILATTIPYAMSFFVNPIISFKSDRYRSRWGRRIPFIMFATPCIAIVLVLLGFSDEVSGKLYYFISSFMPKVSPFYVCLGVIASLLVCFHFFNSFIMSVYYYLFNDIVPQAYLSRFLALYRVVGTLTGASFSFFILQYAQTHMRTIFIVVGVLYFVAFTMVCFKVREGQYPPPAENTGHRIGLWASMRTYFKECFSHRFYWYFFLGNSCWWCASCIGVYEIFLNLSLGLNLNQIGKIQGISHFIAAALLYPAGMLADKIHPIRVMLLAKSFLLLVVPFGLVYLFYDFKPGTVFWISIVITAINLPFGVMYSASSLPMFMRLLPKERYGQFSSADAMLRATCVMVGGIAAGVFIDLMKHIHHGSDFCYRYIPLWTLLFEACSLIFLLLLYRKWKQYGGMNNYTPPTTWDS